MQTQSKRSDNSLFSMESVAVQDKESPRAAKETVADNNTEDLNKQINTMIRNT